MEVESFWAQLGAWRGGAGTRDPMEPDTEETSYLHRELCTEDAFAVVDLHKRR